jgi:Protein of unknown function (DUF3800)
MFHSSDPPAYHVYCDESGDPGIRGGGSDWFAVSACVVSAARNRDIADWISRIKRPMRGQQKPDLHFFLLNSAMKRRASRFLSKLPLRCFVLLSHKQNMIGHRNRRCEERYAWRTYSRDGEFVAQPRATWFHNFTLKVLLERVTAWCEARSIADFNRTRPIDITVARRGGFDIADFRATLAIDHIDGPRTQVFCLDILPGRWLTRVSSGMLPLLKFRDYSWQIL